MHKKTLADDTPIIRSDNLFPVIGIGSSAGGLKAFKSLIKAIPENSGMAYVLVQHLHPEHDSLLPEILQKFTNIPVTEITDHIKVLPDHIYIIPSNKMLLANDGVLQLSPRPLPNQSERNLPIDLFFTSLAEVHQSHAIGVILSGKGSDGTQGLIHIKAKGGHCFAQDPSSAEYDDMPKSAVAAGVIDYIMNPGDIPAKLLELNEQISGNSEEEENDENFEYNDPSYDEAFKKIIDLLQKNQGTDFTHYKQTTVRRRIQRRMNVNKDKTPLTYLAFLKTNKPEQAILFQNLLIPVTSFFRDTQVFSHLCENILAEIESNNNPEIPIRLWVTACSTGQEAYSLAICMAEYLESKKMKNKVQIFATDLNETSIQIARKGYYEKNEVKELSPGRLKEFFTKSKTGYVVNKSTRDLCVFAVHDFLKDPPITKVDFISCRNVLIYMEPYLQKNAISTFHYALNNGGILLLGKSEEPGVIPELFTSLSKENKFYRKKNIPGRPRISGNKLQLQQVPLNGFTKNSSVLTDFQKTADEILISNYTPAGVVINTSMDIVHFRGKTADYLEQLSGKPSHNILQMAKNGLGFELRSLIHKASKSKLPCIKKNIPFTIHNLQQNITVEVIIIPDSIERYYLILFYPTPAPEVKSVNGVKKNPGTKPDSKDLLIAQMEKELVQNREDMRSITEEQETVNEELQSANEELLSSSEELQSLNEELESSKEELEVTNEELTVLNKQTISLNEKIIIERNFAEAIISNLNSPLLVLDKDLKIKSANNSFYETFRVNEPETLGRLIFNIGDKQWGIPTLKKLLEDVLPGKNSIIDFEIKQTFPSIGERVMLINVHEIIREKGTEKLILLTLIDITEKSKFAEREKELLNRFHKIVLQSPVGIAMFRGDNMVVEIANDSFIQMMDLEGKDFLNKPLPEMLTDNKLIEETIISQVLKSGETLHTIEKEHLIKKEGTDKKRYYNISYLLINDNQGCDPCVMCVANEVTEQVQARKSMESQEKMVKNLLKTAPGFICTLSGPNHVFTLVNDHYQKLFGKRKLIGKAIMDALPELKEQPLIGEKLNSVYKTGIPYVGLDIPILSSRDVNLSPELRYFSFSYQPIYREEKEIFSILVFGYEVTDQVNARNLILEMQQDHNNELEGNVMERTNELRVSNELLKNKYSELEKMNHELESFNFLSSHDLQEPLRKIQTFTTLILQTELNMMSEKGKDYFNRLNNAAIRMRKLIQDLITYSHCNIGDYTFEVTDITKLATEINEELKFDIAEKNISIEITNLGKANINLIQFKQAVINLISNSIKFCKKEMPRNIKITGTSGQGASFNQPFLNPIINYYQFCVCDNGIGFDMIYKEKIFEVFKRLHGNSAYEGTGIGLAIVKKIVENHKGHIEAYSEPGKGSTFNIYIPATL